MNLAIDVVIPFHRLELLTIGWRRFKVPGPVVSHMKTLCASLASLAATCEAQQAAIAERDAGAAVLKARITELETAAQPKSIRWTPGMKHAVVMLAKASVDGRISALTTFGLSAHELDSWIEGYDKHGINGLKVTRLQHFRGGRGV